MELDFTPIYGSRNTAHAQSQNWRDPLEYSQQFSFLILHVSQKLKNQSRWKFRTISRPWKCISWCN